MMDDDDKTGETERDTGTSESSVPQLTTKIGQSASDSSESPDSEPAASESDLSESDDDSSRPSPLGMDDVLSPHAQRIKQRELCLRLGLPAPEPERIGGRYRLDALIGQGGMGEVYRAWDANFEREVAIKLVRGGKTSGSGSSQHEQRLVREAQTLAKLNHEHVVRVFDTNTYDGEICISMDFVRGTTLRTWQEGRSEDELLAAYRQAAMGLAAAHALRIVHRDFKPDNVLIGDDGSLRVADFGIAAAIREQDEGATVGEVGRVDRVAPEGDTSELATTLDGSSARLELPATLTRTGAVIGTLRYMAPEQLAGQRADARSDQFSFCVALWEALSGQHPFLAGGERATLEALRKPPRGREQLPRWLQPILARGLSIDPRERFADMLALIDALGRRARRLKVLGFASVAGLAVAIAMYVGMLMAPSEPPPELETCEAFEARIDERWSPARADALGATLRSIDPSASKAVLTGLDGLAQRWRVDAATTCNGNWAPADDSDAHRCMVAWLADFDRITTTLTTVDATQLQQAPELLSRLVPRGSDYCSIQPDPDVSSDVAEPAKRAREAALLGDFEGARAAAQASLEAAERDAGQARYDVRRAEAHAAMAMVLTFGGEQLAALPHFAQAQAHARASEYRQLELDTMLLRSKTASITGKHELAASLIEQAEPLVELLALDPADARRGELLEARGWHERTSGNPSAAIAHHEASRAIFEAAGRPIDAAKAEGNIAECLAATGQLDEAEASYKAALARYEAAGVGPRFPNRLDVELRNRLHVERGLGLLALEREDLAGLVHFDNVARDGSPADRIDALTWALALAWMAGSEELALERADLALDALRKHPNPPADLAANLHALVGAVRNDEAMFLLAEQDARELELEQRFTIQQQFSVWLLEQGRCSDLEARLVALDSLLDDPGAEALDIEGWRASMRARPCPPSPTPEP